MSTYAIGDIQGCCDEFEQLLERLSFDPRNDRLWLVGDLVNRGPDSLATLRRVRAMGDAATVVLGNHDLHLLALASGARAPGKNDTLEATLAAADANELIEWLRARPLAHFESVAGRPTLMVHAGALPSWSAQATLGYAREVEHVLKGPDWKAFFAHMYGDHPLAWDEGLSGEARLRVIVNALTRLRFCTSEGIMDLNTKEGAGSAPPGYLPWFDVPKRRSQDVTVVFGHWSTLGLVVRDDVLGLDSGCVWGGALTAVRLEDRRQWQLACRQYRRPG
jgi:bis(5'-nucleosyl)-tetraphosphatase (symmetrical)